MSDKQRTQSDAPAAATQETALITCSACEAQHIIDDMAQAQEIKPGVIQVMLVCPSCGQRTHAYFDTPGLKAQRDTVQKALAAWQQKKTQADWERYRTARDVFKRAFDEANKRWRRKLGIQKAKEEGNDNVTR